MKKTIELCKVRPGETFTLDGVDFVKLDEDMGQAFALTRDVALKKRPLRGRRRGPRGPQQFLRELD